MHQSKLKSTSPLCPTNFISLIGHIRAAYNSLFYISEVWKVIALRYYKIGKKNSPLWNFVLVVILPYGKYSTGANFCLPTNFSPWLFSLHRISLP